MIYDHLYLLRWGNFSITFFGSANVGSITYKLYFPSFNNDKAANPKNVWNTSTVFPGLSDIPPS
jgi:hypothetical protein